MRAFPEQIGQNNIYYSVQDVPHGRCVSSGATRRRPEPGAAIWTTTRPRLFYAAISSRRCSGRKGI